MWVLWRRKSFKFFKFVFKETMLIRYNRLFSNCFYTANNRDYRNKQNNLLLIYETKFYLKNTNINKNVKKQRNLHTEMHKRAE